MRLRVCLTDTPGSLAQLLALISALKANVLHIYHDRRARDLPIYVTRVDLEIETRGSDHIEEIIHKLNIAGYDNLPSGPISVLDRGIQYSKY